MTNKMKLASLVLTTSLFFYSQILFGKESLNNCLKAEKKISRYRFYGNDSLRKNPYGSYLKQSIQKRWTRFDGPKNSLTISPAALLLRTIHLNYTRYFFNQRIGIGMEGAYTFILSGKKTYQNSDLLDINGPTKMIAFMPFSDGSYASVFVKVYVEDRTFLNMFVSASLFYRNIRYNNATVKWQEPAGSRRGVTNDFYDSLNVDQYQKGFKLLFGVNPVLPIGKVSLDLEGYVGLSLRDVQTNLYHHDFYYITSGEDPSVFPPGRHQKATNMEEQQHKPSLLQPAVGVKIGLRF